MYAITGATGNTGRVVVDALLRRGQKVRAIARNADRLRQAAAMGAEPFTVDLTDGESLARAFDGVRAVYVMMPPDMAAADYRAFQSRVVDAVKAALDATKVPYAVTLSSVGADKSEKTGPILGLHYMEEQLNQIRGLNVLHLRAGYFMENTLAMVGTIQSMGKAAGPLRPDVKLPMIASRDIGAAAAEELLGLKFKGRNTRELLGERDISMAQATAIIGRAIGKPDLQYVQLTDEQLRPALEQMGFSANVADLILEMSAAINSGHIRALEPRSDRNTTPTSYEKFVAEVFVPLYRGRSAAG
ncbi:MAG: NmrA family NAD(P)-binding protein [Acidobacteriota bacterium]